MGSPLPHGGSDCDRAGLFLGSLHRPALLPDQIETFQNQLQIILDKALSGRDSLIIQVDYNADDILLEAAQKTAISIRGRLPLKTKMRVTRSDVTVIHRSTGERQVIYRCPNNPFSDDELFIFTMMGC